MDQDGGGSIWTGMGEGLHGSGWGRVYMDQDGGGSTWTRTGGSTWRKMGKNMNNLAWQPTNLHMYLCLYGGRVIHAIPRKVNSRF